MKRVMLSFACAIGLMGGVHSASIEHVSADVVPGEWTSSFDVAKRYAENNGVPLFILWSNPGCAHCNSVKAACNQADFVNWRKTRKYIMVISEGNAAAKSFIKGLNGRLTGKFPYMGIYWPAGGVSYKFNGYPYNSIWSTGTTIQSRIMNCVDSKLAAWISGGGEAGGGQSVTPPPAPTIGPEWKKARTLYGSYYTSEGALAGRIYLSAGKVSKKGTAKVKAALMGFDGKSKSFSQRSVTVDSTTAGTLTGSVGSYAFSITGNEISGTITAGNVTYEVKPLHTGGALADGDLIFSFIGNLTECQTYPVINGTDYLPINQPFNTKASKWTFARKGTLRYDSKAEAFVMSPTDNPSGLKLTYRSANGYFKGSFVVYAQKTEKSSKRYTATVTGFMVGESGEGSVTIKNVGTYGCTISR